MQCNNPFTFKKVSFSEEAEANLSSYSNPYNWQANLANASDGSSFAQVRLSGGCLPLHVRHLVPMYIGRMFHGRKIEGLDPNLDGKR